MKNSSLKFLVGLFFISQLILSQPVDPPADDDPLPAPIDQWVIMLFLIAIVYGFSIIKRQKEINKY